MSDEQQTSNAADDLAARWLGFEQIFSQDRYEGGNPPWPPSIAESVSEPTPGLFEIIGSTYPDIVVTAAHATNHERDGATKVADRGTGGLAVLLAQVTGCTALVALSTPGDANYDEEHPLKERLAALRPTAVIDLHGMRSRAESDVDLGTGTGPAPAPVVAALDSSDLRVTTNAVFDAMRPTTVTSFAQERGIPAVQIEIGAHLRPPSGKPPALADLVSALVAALEQLTSPTSPGLATVPLKIASGLPTAVVHPDLLPGTNGPVPITVTADDHATVAWAWSAAADGIPEAARSISPGQVGVSRRLRAAVSGAMSVSVQVPPIKQLSTYSALVDDMPSADEVQVNPADIKPGTYLLVQGGVTAWVQAVPRDHVRPGTVRLAYQLRLLTASDRATDNQLVALVAAAPDVVRHGVQADRLQRVNDAVDRTMERLWRALFRAPEFSARVIQAHAGDDGTSIVTLHAAVFDRIGIESGQQVLVRWGGREVVALAVADHDPPTSGSPTQSMKDMQRVNRLWPDLPEGISPHVTVRMSTRLRDQLGAPVATVVTVRRRLRPVLVGNLNSLVVPLASLVLAGAALPDPHWGALGLGTALMSVFALARLRIPQPRSRARVDKHWVEQMAEPSGTPGPEPGRGGERVVR
ncbi:N-formylglutamate amidohydrolase [Promicromonospora sp. Populi]|uniref:N-formylglutamate amidohydrolase n=1 Tax=Promicromonospora sp. Populi TaxID=3239420 RepID=UPI0034E2DB87